MKQKRLRTTQYSAALKNKIHDQFHDRWLFQHLSLKNDHKGHGKCIVFDGNAQNCRYICSSCHIGWITMEGSEDKVRVGCKSSPGHASSMCRLCKHKTVNISDANTWNAIKREWKQGSLASIRSMAIYCRSSEVLVESILDRRIRCDVIEYQVKLVAIRNPLWIPAFDVSQYLKQEYHRSSTNTTDLWPNYCIDEKDASDNLQYIYPQNDDCKTRKDKNKPDQYKTKKFATAGIQAGICPDGIIMTLYENYRHETLAQQFMHLHWIIKTAIAKDDRLKQIFEQEFSIIFDDGCHFEAYCRNIKRKSIDGLYYM